MFEAEAFDIPVEVHELPFFQEVEIAGYIAGLLDAAARNRRSVRGRRVGFLGFHDPGHQPLVIFRGLLRAGAAEELVRKVRQDCTLVELLASLGTLNLAQILSRVHHTDMQAPKIGHIVLDAGTGKLRGFIQQCNRIIVLLIAHHQQARIGDHGQNRSVGR